MAAKILLTSFTTWLPHHTSNSSDELLGEISRVDLPHHLYFSRRMPVDIKAASKITVDKIEKIKPDAVICCGMAEKYNNLTVESQATCEDATLKTTVNLDRLIYGLREMEISHNAGKFVCEGLYYSVLHYLAKSHLDIPCIFVHVPRINTENLQIIKYNFTEIVSRMAKVRAKVPTLELEFKFALA